MKEKMQNYVTFSLIVTYVVVDSDKDVIPIISLLQDGNKGFGLSLAIGTEGSSTVAKSRTAYLKF